MTARKCKGCAEPIPARRPDSAAYCSPECKWVAGKRRARKSKRPTLVPPLLPPTHCIPCGKVACPTEDAAKAAKRTAEIRTGRHDEVRYYECPEGWWHWTRMDANLDGFRARVGGAK